MNAWTKMNRELEDEVWDGFFKRFAFRPSVNSGEWPGITEPPDSITYSINQAFAAESRAIFGAMGMELNLAVLAALRAVVHSDGELYVLDWQHQSYLFRPHAPFSPTTSEEWPIQPFPDGDYYAFIHPRFEFGTFGHPWEQTICLFGKPLLKSFEPHSIPWLGPAVRIDGLAA